MKTEIEKLADALNVDSFYVDAWIFGGSSKDIAVVENALSEHFDEDELYQAAKRGHTLVMVAEKFDLDCEAFFDE